MTLSPWHKFIRYRRFPFKLVLALLLCLFGTLQVLLRETQVHASLEAQQDSFHNLFRPGTDSFIQTMYAIPDVIAHLNSSVYGACCGAGRRCATPVPDDRAAYYAYPNASITRCSIEDNVTLYAHPAAVVVADDGGDGEEWD